jgi:hypothetical protein
MKRPRTGQLFNREDYYEQLEKHRNEIGTRNVPWAYDFISIHPPCAYSTFGIMAPLMLVDLTTGKRPEWESERFKTKKEAVKRARELARIHNTFIVDCP